MSTKGLTKAERTRLKPKLEDGWLPLFPCGGVYRNGDRYVYELLTERRKTFKTHKEASDVLNVLRRRFNAYRAWWKLEADAIVVVHHLYLDPAHWMRFGIEQIDKDIATTNLCCPSKDGNGRYYAHTKDAAGKRVSVHQAVVSAHKLDWKIIDHVDRDQTLDNRIANLADGSGSKNHHNKAMMVNNTSGINGVYERATFFMAEWIETNGRKKSKTFAKRKHGYAAARALAIAARQEADHRLGITSGTTPSVALARKRAAEAAALPSRAELDAEDVADEPAAGPEQGSSGGADDDVPTGETAQPARWPYFAF